ERCCNSSSTGGYSKSSAAPRRKAPSSRQKPRPPTPSDAPIAARRAAPLYLDRGSARCAPRVRPTVRVVPVAPRSSSLAAGSASCVFQDRRRQWLPPLQDLSRRARLFAALQSDCAVLGSRPSMMPAQSQEPETKLTAPDCRAAPEFPLRKGGAALFPPAPPRTSCFSPVHLRFQALPPSFPRSSEKARVLRQHVPGPPESNRLERSAGLTPRVAPLLPLYPKPARLMPPRGPPEKETHRRCKWRVCVRAERGRPGFPRERHSILRC